MIIEDLKSELIYAQKARDVLKISVLRFLFAGIKNREIEYRMQKKEMDDEGVLKVLKKQIKQHEEAILNYGNAKREDLVKKESDELSILKEYLDKYSPQVVV